MTRIVKEKLPATVGVPLIRPVATFKVSPVGRLPEETDQVSAPRPPDAARLAEYEAFRSPPRRAVVVMVKELATRRVKLEERVWAGEAESLRVRVKLDPVGLAEVGVPERSPAAVRVRPAGKEPEVTVQVSGEVPPVEVNVKL